MSHKIANDRIPRVHRNGLDRMGHVGQSCARDCRFHSNVQGPLPGMYETDHFRVRHADHHGPGRIPHKAVIDDSHVKAHDVAHLNSPVPGNPVDHLFVHRNTNMTGVTPISIERALPAHRGDHIRRQNIQLACRYARAHLPRHLIQHLGRHLAAHPHVSQVIRTLDNDHDEQKAVRSTDTISACVSSFFLLPSTRTRTFFFS